MGINNEVKRPPWIKVKLNQGDNYTTLKKSLRDRGLFTVCEEASCPNISDCWSAKTATVMILGEMCTRACKFCHVKTGNPKQYINPDEPRKTAEMARIMDLDYMVVTSVDRDDLKDFGASHFANVVRAIKIESPQTKVEVLVPDFDANPTHMHTLAKSNPFVIAQNMETVRRLTHVVRDRRAGYEKSLDCLLFYKRNYPNISTKTSLMVGLGETWEELEETMDDLIKCQVDIVTFGQYLKPSNRHLRVQRYYKPQEFEALKSIAYQKGFKFVASGPLVRSSYKASDYLKFIRANSEGQG